MGAIRELFGSGTLLGFRVMPKSLPGMSIFTLASGGFFVYAIVMAAVNYFSKDKSKIRKDVGDVDLFQEAQDLKKKEA
jgi:electron transport complex protein RnfE